MKARAPLLLLLVLAGCSGSQSALDAHGTSAIHLKHLIISVIAVCTLVWIVVIIVLGYGLFRPGSSDRTNDAPATGTSIVVTALVAATALVIAALTGASFYTTRSIDGRGDVAITINVTGEQWWWRVAYAKPDGTLDFETANEIHIPVGKRVRLRLESADVIHSFWVPSLAGKQDLVPGRSNTLTVRAERPGVYRGQCAEFCGLQHSHMAMLVLAEDDPDFEQWMANQRANAVEPIQPDAIVGKAVFLAKPCAACHGIRGTSATGTAGPDLTHVANRQTIGAGLMDATQGSLAAWIADPQTLKPGNNMPMVPLTSDELRHISAYMESLR